MMMVLNSYIRRWQRLLRRYALRPEWKLPVQLALSFFAGIVLAAASLANYAQPFALGVLCAGLPGWLPLPFTLGAGLGYWLFWGQAGLQGLVWLAAGLPVCLVLGKKKLAMPLLQPALAALIVSAGGVLFQMWRGEDTAILVYLLRIGLAFGSTWVFQQAQDHRGAGAQWVSLSVLVLSLAQMAPLPFLDLGILTAAALLPAVPFPAVALCGLALDLAQVTAVPMTAVLCLGYLLRLLSKRRILWLCLAPALVYVPVMALCGKWDLLPLPALMAGGMVGLLLPSQGPLVPRRGETGFAQVRLEMAAGVLAQSEQLLLEAHEYPIDEAALIAKAADRACGCCPCRKTCKQTPEAKSLPDSLLHRPLTGVDDLPIDCKKRGRLLLELRRSQDQYRILKADRDRQQEYRGAVVQQYRFLSEYLQELADRLPQRGEGNRQRYQPEVAVCSAGKEPANGDRCLWFAGTECRYYLLLIDGMGTGLGAAEEAKSAGNMLRRLLMAGFPAPYALRSFNSLCTLRGRAGAVTVDLTEIQLDTGRATLYKWGAAPSYLLVPTGPERIGVPGVPPGLSVEEQRETIDRVSLRRGETLVMLSDGIQADAAIHSLGSYDTEAPGTLAARLLEKGKGDGADDATAAVVRLMPLAQ